MSATDSREDQIVAAHSKLIVAVANACRDPSRRRELEPVLQTIQQYGEATLAHALRAILDGRRDEALLRDLEDDDRVIIDRVLMGLRNPDLLPDPEAKPDPAAAAPGLAGLIHKASHGEPGAVHVLGSMAEQMQAVGGDMARLGGLLRPLMQGERNADRLCQDMGALGESLVLSILTELARLERH